jgi:uncharacterized protein YdaU (DUF1376 family)
VASGTGNSLAMLPFFPRDYLAATRHLTLEERGAYTDLLWLQWESGPLPKSPERLARMIGCSPAEFTPIWAAIKPKFVEIEPGLINRRLEQHRDEARSRRDAKVHGAQITNGKRWGQMSLTESPSDSLSVSQTESLSESVSESHSGSPPSPNPSPTPEPSPQRTSRAAARGVPRDLQTSIVAAYHELLPELARVKVWTDKRAKALAARIRERLADGKPADTIEYWRDLFEHVAASDFLCGRSDDWRADLEWILAPNNFAKVIEGRYENRVRRATGATHAHR